MSEVFIFSLSEPCVKVSQISIPVSRVKNRWYIVSLTSSLFVLEQDSSVYEFQLPSPGRYAIYNQELLPLSSSYSKTLLVSDIDGTLLKRTEEGMQAYQSFIKFWIQHFEFNGSLLVYNTGRSTVEYQEIKEFLYEPDLLITLIGNYAYKFGENAEEVLQEDYREVLKEFTSEDWNADVVHEILLEKYEFLRSCHVEATTLNIFFTVPDHIVERHFREMKTFLKNKEKTTIRGLCFACKCVASKQHLFDEHFFEVLPTFSGKNMGIIYAQKKFGFSDENTLIAGDSQNDIDMFKHPCWGVLVANAEPNITAWIKKKSRHQKYQSAHSYANAVVEALTKFQIEY